MVVYGVVVVDNVTVVVVTVGVADVVVGLVLSLLSSLWLLSVLSALLL